MTRYDEGTNMSWQRWGYLAVAIVLAVAFTTGGSASAHSAGDLLGQWLALPLAISAVLVVQGSPATGLRRAAYALALVIVTLLAFQQLPLPEGLWRLMSSSGGRSTSSTASARSRTASGTVSRTATPVTRADRKSVV